MFYSDTSKQSPNTPDMIWISKDRKNVTTLAQENVCLKSEKMFRKCD